MGPRPLAALLQPYTHFCVGSLPFPETGPALEFIRAHPWVLPFWPELPQRSSAELMINRGCSAARRGWRGYDREEAAGLYACLDHFAEAWRQAPLIKCQLAGPFSLTLALVRDRPPSAAQVRRSAEHCARQIEWQRSVFERFSAPLLFVLDDPALGQWGRLSAAMRQAIRDAYSYLYVITVERGNYLGVHCCDGFSPGIAGLSLDLFSFDARSSGDLQEAQQSEALTAVEALLREGKVLVPGFFPARAAGESLQAVYEEGAARHDAFRALLRRLRGVEHVLLSADCGHAFATPEWLDCLYRPLANHTLNGAAY